MRPAPAKIVKSKFTPEEDKKLVELVNASSEVDWSQIATKMKTRNSRQCRERWQNYLNPNLNNNSWSPEEDKLILERFREIGPHWNFIGKTFNRSGNAVRNRYLVLKRHQNKQKQVFQNFNRNDTIQFPNFTQFPKGLSNRFIQQQQQNCLMQLVHEYTLNPMQFMQGFKQVQKPIAKIENPPPVVQMDVKKEEPLSCSFYDDLLVDEDFGFVDNFID